MKPTPKTGYARVWAALFYSLNGLRLAVRNEAAFRQELGLFTVLLVILFFLPLPILFKGMLFFANTIVLITELLNAAIESVVDMTAPDYHVLAQQAKDLGSAAVFVSLVLAAVLWLLAVYQIVLEGATQTNIL